MRYHLTLIRMVIIKNSANNKCWQGCKEKRTFLYCWWKYKLLQPLWKTVWRFLRKLKIELPYDPGTPFLGMCMCAKSFQSCPTLCDPMDGSPLGPLSMGFSRQEYRKGLSCPPLGDLRNPGIEPTSPGALALQVNSLPLSH